MARRAASSWKEVNDFTASGGMKGLLTKCLHTVCQRMRRTAAVCEREGEKKQPEVTPTNAIWVYGFLPRSDDKGAILQVSRGNQTPYSR